MEELKSVNIVSNLNHRAVKLQRVIYDSSQRLAVDIFTEKTVCYMISYLLEREFIDIVEKLLWKWFDTFRHI